VDLRKLRKKSKGRGKKAARDGAPAQVAEAREPSPAAAMTPAGPVLPPAPVTPTPAAPEAPAVSPAAPPPGPSTMASAGADPTLDDDPMREREEIAEALFKAAVARAEVAEAMYKAAVAPRRGRRGA